ncbi:hypothetical protein [Sorangium sp. So ce861]|uniref:hypothetical protein n=1 Tax=Sorangium sp. So ce861 TaxID=3133323 RepID=UPI003F61AC37
MFCIVAPTLRLTSAISTVLRRPGDAPLAAFALAVGLFAIAYPFAVTRYAPMTDLPFHAAHTSILRHYADDAWRLREQFELQPLAVPYLSMYALGALLMLVFPPLVAVKIAAAAMLALVPLGLAVLLDGLKKSPLLALAALPLAWGDLAHWGFLNFLGAMGLFAMAVGLALKVLDAPTPARRAALAAALTALFFSHVFRFPLALLALAVTARAAGVRSLERARPLLAPVGAPALLFAAWFVLRPRALRGELGGVGLHPSRLGELPERLFGGCADPGESAAARAALLVAAAALALSAAAGWAERRGPAAPGGPAAPAGRPAWLRPAAVPALCALGSLALYLTLPMKMGPWWYVYPREATVAVFLALAALPDLPRARWARGAVVAALGGAGLLVGSAVAGNYAQFHEATADFHAITRAIPPAPRLLYLVLDGAGSTCSNAPFLHLPAYVQAERGGWLSFNFARWGAAPIAFRAPDAAGSVVPPVTAPAWAARPGEFNGQWAPGDFSVERHGGFFDWFLVRSRASPDALFAADPGIEPVNHVGTWWLYRRRPGAPGAGGRPRF